MDFFAQGRLAFRMRRRKPGVFIFAMTSLGSSAGVKPLFLVFFALPLFWGFSLFFDYGPWTMDYGLWTLFWGLPLYFPNTGDGHALVK